VGGQAEVRRVPFLLRFTFPKHSVFAPGRGVPFFVVRELLLVQNDHGFFPVPPAFLRPNAIFSFTRVRLFGRD